MTFPNLDLSSVRLLVLGDIMLDRYWFGDAHRISPEAPVPVVHVSKTEERLGGATNVARNAMALCVHAGGHVAMLGVVGDDDPGRSISTLLGQASIQAHLHIDASLPTTVKLRVLAQQQQLLRMDFEATPQQDALDAVLHDFHALLPDFPVVVLSDYGKGGLAHIEKMIAAARAAGKTVLVDPKGDDYSRYRGATILTPNRSELRQIVGRWHSESDLIARAQTLRHELDFEALLLTRSEEGMTLFTEAEVLHVPAHVHEVFDVSGAGDTVIATLAVMLAAGVPLGEAVGLANRAAGIVVTKLGTATVSMAELMAAQS